MLAALAGGVVGVLIAGSAPPSAPYLAAGLLYAAAAWWSGRLTDPYAHPHARALRMIAAIRVILRELLEGLCAIWTRPSARLPLIGIFIVRTIGMFVAIAAILVIKDIYPHVSDDSGKISSSAFALGAAGVGAFTAAIATSFFGGRFNRPQLILSGFIVSGVGIIALGGIIDIYAVLGLTFVGGFGTFLTKVAVDAQVQDALPDDMRGRAFALYDILYNLASVAAGALMVTFQHISFRPLLMAAGVGTLIVTAGMYAAMRRAELL
jgi:MFS family permease